MSAVTSPLCAYTVVVDHASKTLTVNGRALHLGSLQQFNLIAKLASDPRRVFTRDELLVEVWGWEPGSTTCTTTRTLDRRMSTVRKLLPDGLLIARRGVGYSLLAIDSASTVKVIGQRRTGIGDLFDQIRELAGRARELGDQASGLGPVQRQTARNVAKYLTALAATEPGS